LTSRPDVTLGPQVLELGPERTDTLAAKLAGMRLTTFNMRSGGSRAHWEELLATTAADIVLAQETKDRELHQRLEEEFGVVPAWARTNPDQPLPQCLGWDRDPHPPFHCDGIFAPAAWMAVGTTAEVLDSEPWTSLSDHNPLVVDVMPTPT
jgi:endonuclease/exonuclease/phosphatase family metal-dependent hydrolase